MVVRTAAAIVKTAEATAVATPVEAAVIEMVVETGEATEVVIETAKGGTAVATPERVAETGAATEGPIKMADLRTENSDPATIGVDPEEAVEAPTPLETVMANLNNLMVTEKMVSINKLYEKTRKIWKNPDKAGKNQKNLEKTEDKQNETKKVLGISRICRTRIFRCWSAILSLTHPAGPFSPSFECDCHAHLVLATPPGHPPMRYPALPLVQQQLIDLIIKQQPEFILNLSILSLYLSPKLLYAYYLSLSAKK